jgi:tetratricopeptide (TPR) repeat protein
MNKKIYLFIIFLVFSLKNFSQTPTFINKYFEAVSAQKYGKPEQALSILKEIQKTKQTNNFIIEKIGDLYFSQKKYKKAIIQYKYLYDNGQNLISFKIAKAYSIAGNTDSAIYFLKKYLSNYKKKSKPEIISDPAFDKLKQSEQWTHLWNQEYYYGAQKMLSEAKYLYEYSKLFDALDKADALLKKYNKYSEGYYLKALILSKLNNSSEAVKMLTKAIKYSPQTAEYYLARAKEYENLKKYKKSIEDYQQYIKKYPYNLEAYKSEAEVYGFLGRYDDAIKTMQYYLKYSNQDDSARFELANIYYKQGDYLSTIRIMNFLFEKNPHNTDYYYLRALAYMKSQMYKLAFHDFSQVLDLSPQTYECYYYLGIVNFKMNKLKNACSDWHISIEHHDYRANDYYYQYCKKYSKEE